MSQRIAEHPEGRTSSVPPPVDAFGLLPAPEVLREYERIVPGAAGKLVELGRQEAAFWLERERKLLESVKQAARSRVRLLAGGLLASVLIILCSLGLIALWALRGVGSVPTAALTLVVPLVNLGGGFWLAFRVIATLKRERADAVERHQTALDALVPPVAGDDRGAT